MTPPTRFPRRKPSSSSIRTMVIIPRILRRRRSLPINLPPACADRIFWLTYAIRLPNAAETLHWLLCASEPAITAARLTGFVPPKQDINSAPSLGLHTAGSAMDFSAQSPPEAQNSSEGMENGDSENPGMSLASPRRG